ncbi:hypothetical protein [Pseudoflavonifractor sp. An85]|uniref:hypothetical protein n=1 Tax=Pseudoflavonifractor sp. An85 TaxID=1965661 RepID=UPI000B3A9506|nr:hypothetical protein [Pseudoflavonifractor sp. An85]OUN25974.1 hypothetical protein B5G37_01730 [Pseudoflavonifractor sp. An85]
MSRFEMFLQRAAETQWNFNVFVALAVVVVLFVLEIIWMRRNNSKDRERKCVKKAKELGHVVYGKRISVWDDDLTRTSVSSYVHATYVYEVDGKEYKYNYLKRAAAPLTLKLYYINNPKRAFTGEKKSSVILSLLFYLIPLAAGIAVMNLLGGA